MQCDATANVEFAVVWVALDGSFVSGRTRHVLHHWRTVASLNVIQPQAGEPVQPKHRSYVLVDMVPAYEVPMGVCAWCAPHEATVSHAYNLLEAGMAVAEPIRRACEAMYVDAAETKQWCKHLVAEVYPGDRPRVVTFARRLLRYTQDRNAASRAISNSLHFHPTHTAAALAGLRTKLRRSIDLLHKAFTEAFPRLLDVARLTQRHAHRTASTSS